MTLSARPDAWKAAPTIVRLLREAARARVEAQREQSETPSTRRPRAIEGRDQAPNA